MRVNGAILIEMSVFCVIIMRSMIMRKRLFLILAFGANSLFTILSGDAGPGGPGNVGQPPEIVFSPEQKAYIKSVVERNVVSRMLADNPDDRFPLEQLVEGVPNSNIAYPPFQYGGFEIGVLGFRGTNLKHVYHRAVSGGPWTFAYGENMHVEPDFDDYDDDDA